MDGAEELRFVDEQARDGDLRGIDGLDERIVIDIVRMFGIDPLDVAVGGNDEVDLAGDAQTGHDLRCPLGVDQGFGQQNTLTAFLIVEGRLQKSGRLTGIHRPVPEVEFGHCRPLSVVRADTEDYRVPLIDVSTIIGLGHLPKWPRR